MDSNMSAAASSAPPTVAGSVDLLPLQTLGDLLRRQRRERPDALAIRFQGEDLSYAQLWQRAARVAQALTRLGARPGSRVAHCERNSVVCFELLFGCALIGAVLVPVNWRLAREEIAWVLQDAQPVLLVADPAFDAAVQAARGLGIPWLSTETAPSTSAGTSAEAAASYSGWRDAASDADPAVDVALDDVAIQMYTSGTTGRPKGAMLSHRAVNTVRIGQRAGWSRWRDDDVCLISMPLFHIGGVGTALASLCAGARMVLVREFDAGQFLTLIGSEGITRLFLVPAAIQMLLDHLAAAATDFSRVQYISFGSSPMQLPLLERAMALFGCGFVQVYGLTESSGTVVANPVERGELPTARRLASVGRALDGVALRIALPDGREAAAGETGEVQIRSASAMQGYWRLPEATAEAFTPDGWLRTGDVGTLDADGYLYLIDRLKDMIISGGENVYPAEVEAALLRVPGVKEVAVIGVPDRRWGEAVTAVIVPQPGAALDEGAVIAAARTMLAGYKVPKTIVLREALPRNAAGKVLRRELRAPFWQGTGRQI
jgi:long-chain acyl-CoA synthetase